MSGKNLKVKKMFKAKKFHRQVDRTCRVFDRMSKARSSVKFHIQEQIGEFRKKMFARRKKQIPLSAHYRKIDSVKSVLKKMAGEKSIVARAAKTFSRMFK